MYDLRPVTEADWPLWQDLFRVFEDNIRAMNSSWSPVHQQDYARTAFDRSRDVKSVVLKGGQTAGLCAYSWEPDRSLYLSDLIVAPDYRNAGLGAEIIGDIQAVAASVGQPAWLHVMRNSPAIRLYERCGFVPFRAKNDGLDMRWTPLKMRP